MKLARFLLLTLYIAYVNWRPQNTFLEPNLFCQLLSLFRYHTLSHDSFHNKKAVLSQRWPRNAPYIWAPWKFSELPDYAHGHCSQHFLGLLFRSTLWMFLQNLKSVALPVSEIIGGTKKFGQPLDTPTLPFLQNFLWALFALALFKCTRQIWSPWLYLFLR